MKRSLLSLPTHTLPPASGPAAIGCVSALWGRGCLPPGMVRWPINCLQHIYLCPEPELPISGTICVAENILLGRFELGKRFMRKRDMSKFREMLIEWWTGETGCVSLELLCTDELMEVGMGQEG